MAAEQERLGVHPGDEVPVLPWKGKPFVWERYPGPRQLVILPRDNPAHRERHGLEGAYDSVCNDICCKPPKPRLP